MVPIAQTGRAGGAGVDHTRDYIRQVAGSNPAGHSTNTEGAVMQRAVHQCETCPFRDADEKYKRSSANIPAENWPCHTEAGYVGYSDVQCRGHWEAARKYGRK